ncbi:unnamed protein product [Spirodela intermedia]|uniref:Uncharacterized protein n=1 Tax=Spirodela intermedia TaxID=51605 RepID=A0A7I8JDK5_SPIIN|nr:unnamed protein product [Spirodela intermedia]CAA6668246.1 unnamed protein product [Spirodela intermedia]
MCFLLLLVGPFNVSRACLSFLKWIYTFFLRQPKNILDYGSRAIVTGATDGTGKALAFEMARKGLNLVLVDRDFDMLRHVATAINVEVSVAELVMVVFELSRDILEGLCRLQKAIECLDIGILVNNAGVSYAELANVNMEALTDIMRLVFLGMLGKKGFVSIGSRSFVILPLVRCFYGHQRVGVLSWFVNGLSKSLHHEYKNHGVDVQCQVGLYSFSPNEICSFYFFFNFFLLFIIIKIPSLAVTNSRRVCWSIIRAIRYGTTMLTYWRHSIQCFFGNLNLEKFLNAWLLHSARRRRLNYPSR